MTVVREVRLMILFFFQTYLNEAMEPDNNVPQGIMGKHKIIFCNMEEIYDFHKKWVFFIYKLSF